MVKGVDMKVATHDNQVKYQAALINFAIFAIIDAKEQLLFFDPQGRLLIEVDSTLILRRQTSAKTLCSVDIFGTELEESFLNSLGEAYRPKLQALVNSGSRSSVISLQEEVMMHVFLTLNLIKKAFKGAEKELTENQINTIKNKLSSHVNKKVNESFKKALDYAYKNKAQPLIEIGTLNKVLDEARKPISLDAERFLIEKVKELNNGPTFDKSVIEKITKHLAESTTATNDDFLHTDASAGLTTFIEHSLNTSHNRGEGGKILALRRIQTHQYSYDSGNKTAIVTASTFPRVQIRVPSIALKGGDTWKAINDVVVKLVFIKDKCSSQVPDTSKTFIYNLYTALNGNSPIDRYDERNNKQRESADRILKGAHLYNKNEVKAKAKNSDKPPSYCFVQNISVNGFGQSLGYSWYKKNTTKEATLMAEIALLHTLKGSAGNDKKIEEAYNDVIVFYENFLKNINNDNEKIPYFHNSIQGKQAVAVISELKENLNQGIISENKKELESKSREENVNSLNGNDIPALAKNALQKLFSQDKHFDHKYAKLIQTLSVFCEEFSIGGCKSANERAQAINGRVWALLRLEHELLPNKKQTASKEAKITAQELIDELKSDSFDAARLSKALDSYYNEYGLQAGPSKVSLLDQGGPSKLQSVSQAGWMPNTNYGESAKLSYLYQTKASKMQAHKGLAGRLKTLITGEENLSKSWKMALGLLRFIGLGFIASKIIDNMKSDESSQRIKSPNAGRSTLDLSNALSGSQIVAGNDRKLDKAEKKATKEGGAADKKVHHDLHMMFSGGEDISLTTPDNEEKVPTTEASVGDRWPHGSSSTMFNGREVIISKTTHPKDNQRNPTSQNGAVFDGNMPTPGA
jgi:hypothetical protein